MKKNRRIELRIGLSEFKNWLEEIDYWLYYKLWAPIVGFFDMIKADWELLCFYNNEKAWRHWDYEYMLMLLDFKLKSMHDCFKGEGIVSSEDLKKMLDSINVTRDKIRRYINNSEVYEEEHPFPIEIGYRFEPTEDGEGSHMITVNEEEHRDFTEDEEDLHLEWLKAMYENENKEWDAIWDSIKEHGRSWWS